MLVTSIYSFFQNVFKSLPNDKIVDRSNLKAFADKIYVTEKLKFVLGMVENIMGKGQNAGYLFFLQGC